MKARNILIVLAVLILAAYVAASLAQATPMKAIDPPYPGTPVHLATRTPRPELPIGAKGVLPGIYCDNKAGCR